MARLQRARDPNLNGATEGQPSLHEADAVRVHPAIELSRRHEFRTFEPSTETAGAGPREVRRDGDQQAHDKDRQATPEGRPCQLRQRLIAIDPPSQERVQLRVSEGSLLPHQFTMTHTRGAFVEGRHRAADARREDIVIERESVTRTIDNL
jgi:hypothetical protein